MTRLFAAEMASRVVERAVQVFGGMGYIRGEVAERCSGELRGYR